MATILAMRTLRRRLDKKSGRPLQGRPHLHPNWINTAAKLAKNDRMNRMLNALWRDTFSTDASKYSLNSASPRAEFSLKADAPHRDDLSDGLSIDPRRAG